MKSRYEPGWWYTYPSEKWSSSVGIMTFPTEWKKTNVFKPPTRTGSFHGLDPIMIATTFQTTFRKHPRLTGAFYVGNGWVAGGCWDDDITSDDWDHSPIPCVKRTNKKSHASMK